MSRRRVRRPSVQRRHGLGSRWSGCRFGPGRGVTRRYLFAIRDIMGGGDSRHRFLASRSSRRCTSNFASDSATISRQDGPPMSRRALCLHRDHLSISGPPRHDGQSSLTCACGVCVRRTDRTGSMRDDGYSSARSPPPTAVGRCAVSTSATYTLSRRGRDGRRAPSACVAGQKNVVVTLRVPARIDGTLVGFSSPPVRALDSSLVMSSTNVYASGPSQLVSHRRTQPRQLNGAIGAAADARSFEVVGGPPRFRRRGRLHSLGSNDCSRSPRRLGERNSPYQGRAPPLSSVAERVVRSRDRRLD